MSKVLPNSSNPIDFQKKLKIVHAHADLGWKIGLVSWVRAMVIAPVIREKNAKKPENIRFVIGKASSRRRTTSPLRKKSSMTSENKCGSVFGRDGQTTSSIATSTER